MNQKKGINHIKDHHTMLSTSYHLSKYILLQNCHTACKNLKKEKKEKQKKKKEMETIFFSFNYSTKGLRKTREIRYPRKDNPDSVAWNPHLK